MTNRLHQALTNVMGERGFRDFIEATGGELIAPMTLEQLDVFYQIEMRRSQQISREIGLKPE